MSSVGEALPQEIKRVIRVRDAYRDLDGASFAEGAVERITASIDRALDAIGSQDALACILAYQDLKGIA